MKLWDEAERLIIAIAHKGFKMDEDLSNILNVFLLKFIDTAGDNREALAVIKRLEKILNRINEMGLTPSLKNYGTLIDSAIKIQALEQAKRIALSLDSQHWNKQEIPSIINRMFKLLFSSSNSSLTPVRASLDEATLLLDMLILKGFIPNIATFNTFITQALHRNDLQSAHNLFLRITANQDIQFDEAFSSVLFNYFLNLQQLEGNQKVLNQALPLLEALNKKGFNGDARPYALLLHACNSLNKPNLIQAEQLIYACIDNANFNTPSNFCEKNNNYFISHVQQFFVLFMDSTRNNLENREKAIKIILNIITSFKKVGISIAAPVFNLKTAV